MPITRQQERCCLVQQHSLCTDICEKKKKRQFCFPCFGYCSEYLAGWQHVNWGFLCGPSWSPPCRSLHPLGSAAWWYPPPKTAECWYPPADQAAAPSQAVASLWLWTATELFFLCPNVGSTSNIEQTSKNSTRFTLNRDTGLQFFFTLMTVSGVMSFICFSVLELCGGDTCPALPRVDETVLVSLSRGRVFLKILTIRRLMGNMMIELWMPIITCCQVNSMWPEEKKSLMSQDLAWSERSFGITAVQVLWSLNYCFVIL